MAGTGGYRPGSGRKEGSTNVRTREIAEKAIQEGITPLEFMIKEMRWANSKIEELRAQEKPDLSALALLVKEGRELAKDAAPYIHPRLQAVEVTGRDGGPVQTEDVSNTELARGLAHILHVAANQPKGDTDGR